VLLTSVMKAIAVLPSTKRASIPFKNLSIVSYFVLASFNLLVDIVLWSIDQETERSSRTSDFRTTLLIVE